MNKDTKKIIRIKILLYNLLSFAPKEQRAGDKDNKTQIFDIFEDDLFSEEKVDHLRFIKTLLQENEIENRFEILMKMKGMFERSLKTVRKYFYIFLLLKLCRFSFWIH